MRRLLLAPLAALVLTGLAGCAGGSGGSDQPTVVAAFYPLAYAAEQVGGDAVDVIDLTPPGAEPHDLELTAQQVAQIAEADLVLYIPGFQPAVDEAVAQQAGDRALDVTQGIDLIPGDPHVWLDPVNMSIIGTSIADRLGTSLPDLADTATAGAQRLSADMSALNDEWTAGTQSCTIRDLVVSHEAFGYLARAYGFTQVGIAGLSPESEPSPARLAEVAALVKNRGVTTIYYETLVDPKIAQTVAAETGATTAVLDPLEGLPPGSDGNYVSVMRDN
ncbi:MAG: metal ABC transporter substrate-binding protein, partial [Candidatus Nanopelagicales bacterium]